MEVIVRATIRHHVLLDKIMMHGKNDEDYVMVANDFWELVVNGFIDLIKSIMYAASLANA